MVDFYNDMVENCMIMNAMIDDDGDGDVDDNTYSILGCREKR